MMDLHKLGLLALGGAALLSMGCTMTSGSGGTGGSGGNPVGPVAHNAAEAFPDKPASVPVIGAAQIAEACAASVACATAGSQYTQSDKLTALSLCTTNAAWSAERAIPLSDLVYDNERAEYFVGCVQQHAGDCAAISACTTGRDPGIECQEDGCKGYPGAQVTCDGTVATIKSGDKTITRDCALAYAACDASSETGCTDRHYTACPAGGSASDRCDGDVRLGCDGAGQVSYHDCSRMGGTCGATSDGSAGCVYTEGTADAGCSDGSRMPSCTGTTLDVCVNDRLVSVDAPALCSG